MNDIRVTTLETIALQLSDSGMDEEMITAQAVLDSCSRLAVLDARIAAAEARRNAALHEMDHHRGGFASRLRTAPDVIDAETVPVESGEPRQHEVRSVP
jgi:hypothetical protein